MPLPSSLPDAWSPTPVRGEVAALAGRGSRAAVALQGGAVLVSADGGLGWEAATPLPGVPGATTLLLLPEAVIAGTAGRGLLRADLVRGDGTGEQRPVWTGHSAWTGHLEGRTVLSLAEGAGAVLAGTLRTGVFRSTDGGRTWNAASAGLPLHGEGLEVAQLVATRRACYALHPFGVSESVDGGRRWRPVVAGLPPHRQPSTLAAVGDALLAEVDAHLYRLDPSPPDRPARWVGGSNGGPVRLIGQAGDALFAEFSGGHALGGQTLGRSEDAGRTWESVQRGLPADGLVTGVGATGRAVLVALDGEGLWSRRAPVEPDAGAEAAREAGTLQGGRVETALLTNDPNPFARTTTIPFTLSAAAEVALTVHDVSDAEVVRLAEGTYAAGEHRVVFEAEAFPPGFYHCRLSAGGRSYDRSMLLLRP